MPTKGWREKHVWNIQITYLDSISQFFEVMPQVSILNHTLYSTSNETQSQYSQGICGSLSALRLGNVKEYLTHLTL
jgi:hypothetical protein